MSKVDWKECVISPGDVPKRTIPHCVFFLVFLAGSGHLWMKVVLRDLRYTRSSEENKNKRGRSGPQSGGFLKLYPLLVVSQPNPLRWKEFLYHAGLITGGRTLKEGGKKNAIQQCQEKDITGTGGRFLRPWWRRLGLGKKNTREGSAILAGTISLRYLVWFSVSWLYWISGKPPRWQDFASKDSYATTSSGNRVEECLVSEARQTPKQRAVLCGSRLLQKWSPRARVPLNPVPEDQGRVTNVQDLVIYAQNRLSVIADLIKTGEFNTFSEESKMTRTWGRSNCFELVWSFWENTVPVLRQILTRSTVILHFRNMSKVFKETEAQKQTNILKSCQFPHTLRKDYSRDAEQGRSQEQYDHFKANESTRWRQDMILLRSDSEATNCTEFHKHCKIVDSFMSIDFSCTAARYEKNYTLGVNECGRFPTSIQQTSRSERESGKSQSVDPSTLAIPTATKRRTWEIVTAMETLGMNWSQSSSSSSTRWTPQEWQE